LIIPVFFPGFKRNSSRVTVTAMNLRVVAAAGLGCAILATPAKPGAAQSPALYQQTQHKGREIGRLTGDVYYARMDDYVSAFMVTRDGIILVEPIGTEFAAWLKSELAARFHTPVKYVIYSHHHWDHASGASVYADTATIIGHVNMAPHLAPPPATTPLPENVRSQDANGDGRLDRNEAQGVLKTQFDLYDADHNGVLTGAELTRGPLAYVIPPTETYSDRRTLTLGGKNVEIISIPTPHADDNTIVRFVDGTNVVFASDWITVKRLPFGTDVALKDEIARTKLVAAMDFEHFVCSHGMLGKKADVAANIRYREELREAVSKAQAAGETLEQAQKDVLMNDYKDWEFYEQQRPANVAGTYRALTANR
jgi:glyoxylase-like metal-dependent hydrolase (beta-lactamase superfamily II)